MAHAQTVPDLDRLPWLTEVPARPARRGPGRALLAAALAIAMVAAGSFWLGLRSGEEEAFQPDLPVIGTVTETIDLPEPSAPAPAIEDVRPAPMPEVRPVTAPPQPAIAEPKVRPKPVVHRSAPAKPRAEVAPKAKPKAVARPKPVKLYPWPAARIEGAHGRLIRLGTFKNQKQAGQGWWQLVKLYPGLRTLPAVIVPVRSQRNRRIYYRLQLGTATHAQSEVLCQRLRMVGQSCIVIGLPAELATRTA